MRPRTMLGLIFITAAGLALAWLFRATGQPGNRAVAGREDAAPVARNDHSRGRIVPLMVDEGFSGTAFIGAAPSASVPQPDRDAVSRVATQPTIRRQPFDRPASAPRLNASFPRPLGLLGINTRAADLNPGGEESPVAPRPETHVIADGDTLPALAKTYLGNADRAPEIYQLNHDRLPSRELLPIGLEIALPQP